MLALRDYQERAVRSVLSTLDRRPLLVMATGAGKTFTAAELVRRLGRRTLWLAHRRELIDQAARSLSALELRTGVILAGREPTPGAQVQVASVQTLIRRRPPEAGLVVIDEAHHATGPSYARILEHYRDAAWLGLTATPFRLDGQGLGSAGFGEIIVAARPAELCARGTLIEPSVFAPDNPDLGGIKIRAGEFASREAAAAMSAPQLVGNVVQTWLRRAQGRRTVVFTVDVAHSQLLRDRFRQAGVRCEHLDGATPLQERQAILARLASGETTVLCNCMVLTEGWDLPALEVAVIARPTASLNLHLQIIGRIMRACPGKAGALVLDHAGNHHRHGMVTDHLEYSLDARPKKRAGEGGTKACPECTCLVAFGTRECPECGHEFPASERQAPEEVEGELVQLTGPMAETHEERARFYQRMIAIGHRRGVASPSSMASAAFKKRYGSWPLVAGGRLVDPTQAPEDLHELQEEWFAEGLRIAERKKKPDPSGFARWLVRTRTNELRTKRRVGVGR